MGGSLQPGISAEFERAARTSGTGGLAGALYAAKSGGRQGPATTTSTGDLALGSHARLPVGPR